MFRRHHKTRPDGLTTQRIEAFSDGVFAIAITLLILEIKVPHGKVEGGASLARALCDLWPSYFAYVLSFLIIGIYWANHHYVFQLYRHTNHVFNLLNVFFLMCISFLPLPTAVLGDYVTDAAEQKTAVTFYALGLFLPAFSWSAMWLYSRHSRLLDRNLTAEFCRRLTRQYLFSALLYVLSFALSFWSAPVSLAISVGLTLLYLLPPPAPVYENAPGSET